MLSKSEEELEQNIVKLKSNLEITFVKNTELVQQIVNLQTRLSNNEATAKETEGTNELKQALQLSKEEVEKTRSMLQMSESQHATTERELDETLQKMKTLESELKDTEERFYASADQIGKLQLSGFLVIHQFMRSHYFLVNDEEVNSLTLSENPLTASQSKFASLSEMEEKLEQQIKQLQGDLASTLDKNSELVQYNKKLSENLKIKTFEMEHLNTQINEKPQSNPDTANKIDLENALEITIEDVDKLKSSLRTSEFHLANTNRELGDTLQQMSTLEGELSETKEKLKVATDQIFDLHLSERSKLDIESYSNYGHMPNIGLPSVGLAGVGLINSTIVASEFQDHRCEIYTFYAYF